MMKKLFLLGIIFAMSSCAHTPIRTLSEHIKFVHIPIFVNQTIQYGLEEVITSMVIDEFVKDGRLEVVDRKLADAQLTGTIISYEKIPFSYDKEGNINKYKVSIKVSFGLTDLRENEILWEEEWQETVLYIPTTPSYQPKEFEITSEEEAVESNLSKIAYSVVNITIKR